VTCIVAVFAALAGVIVSSLGNRGETYIISASYAFDVSDPEQLAGYANDIFIGRVVGPGKSVELGGEVYTDYRVVVQERLKGRVVDTVTVRQTGGTAEGDTWVLEDQPLLRPGGEYLLVVTREPDRPQLTLVAGPESARAVRDSADRTETREAWKRAIQNQRPPDTLVN